MTDKVLKKTYLISTIDCLKFEGDTDDELMNVGFKNIGTHNDWFDEEDEGWIAYHHHSSGVSARVEYDTTKNPNEHEMELHGLESAVQLTLDSLKQINIIPVREITES